MLRKTLILALLLVTSSGCASRDAGRGRGANTFSDGGAGDAHPNRDGSAIVQTALEGVYVIETWTINSTGCDVEGVSALATQGDRFAFVRYQSLLGEGLVSAGTCPTQTDCEDEAFAGDEDIRLSGNMFDRGSDGTGWEGDLVALSWSGDSDCSGTVKTNRMTWDGSTLAIRAEDRSVSFAQSGLVDDECPTETAKQVAQSTPCEALEVITATPLGT